MVTPWFPIINSDKCDGCVHSGNPRCIEFCPNGVFTFQGGKAVVSFPAKCGGGCSTVHCSACAPLCHKRAIVFPFNQTVAHEEVKSKELIRKTTCRICGKSYWTNREKDICFDCETR